jgi:L-alanine-DL-glutamate epimerase-like enolase superfamily enzyme
MPKPTDLRCRAMSLYFLPVHTRMPLKFGAETVTYVTCARACVRVSDRSGRSATGWGETPLSVQWVWPSPLPYEQRHEAMKQFCMRLGEAWVEFGAAGHPIELGYEFQEQVLPGLLQEFNRKRADSEAMPWLGALVCCSVFDQALHDAFGQLLDRPVYQTYNAEYMNRPLADFIDSDSGVSFAGLYPSDFLSDRPAATLRAWHLVGGLDPVEASELTGNEPNDGYPVLLGDWIERDGLNCLKIKLRGNDAAWDCARVVQIGRLAIQKQVDWLSTDFNCTVTDPNYVNEILDCLRDEHPRIYGMILYVEQPFPYELERHRIDVRSVSGRKPLFLDESAHDWKLIRLGRELGWTGVALKTCKTQTGALLSACWARAHGMSLMVQDLTNPMLAQIPHLLLAAHTGTIMGVETNSMQFYPEASALEARVHPGIYRRRNGMVDLATLAGGAGFGYQVEEIQRQLPEPAAEFGD